MQNIVAVVFLFTAILCSGQSDTEDVLRLKSMLTDTTSLKTATIVYNDLAWEYSATDIDSANLYVQKAIEHAEELNDPYWKAVSLEMLAILKEISGQNEEAIKLYFEVIPIRESIGGKGLENTFNNMAIIFRTQNNFETAYSYFRRSYQMELNKNNKRGIAAGLINMAITEKHLDRRDSIQHHLLEALSISKEIADRNIETHAMINLGILYQDENQTDSALYYFEKASILTGNSDIGNSVVINIGLAEEHVKMGQMTKAIAFLDNAEELARELRSIDYLKRIFSEKAEVYAAKGDYKQAYTYANRFFVMNDSLTNLKLLAQTNDLEKKYETERKERQITELQLKSVEQQLIAKASNNQRRILIFVAIILLLAVWFAFYRYRKEQRTATLLQEKNETIATALHDREILLKEIHHRVKNNLQVVSSLLSIQGREISDEKALEAVNESKHRVQSMALIHQYLYGKNDLKSIDMQQYVQQLSTNLFNAYRLDHDLVKLEVEVSPILLDIDTAIPLGIIINELITNALKYAFPENRKGLLRIALHEENQRLNLYISDNGVGKSAVDGADITFGTKLINAFRNKLKAELEMNTENGYSVLFSIAKYKRI